MKRIHLNIAELRKSKVGELFLYFSSVEWLITNAIFLTQIPKDQYEHTKNLGVSKQYFQTLLELGCGKKLDKLGTLGYDTSKLRQIAEYRNAIAHGIVLDDQSVQKVKHLVKGKTFDFDNAGLEKHINTLKEEGGRLVEFIESRDYTLAK